VSPSAKSRSTTTTASPSGGSIWGGARRAGLEYDSDRFHNPRHWARDEARQLCYAAVGWDVRRVGKNDLLPSVTWLDDHLWRLAHRIAA
jgi:hypothetical protein